MQKRKRTTRTVEFVRIHLEEFRYHCSITVWAIMKSDKEYTPTTDIDNALDQIENDESNIIWMSESVHGRWSFFNKYAGEEFKITCTSPEGKMLFGQMRFANRQITRAVIKSLIEQGMIMYVKSAKSDSCQCMLHFITDVEDLIS